MRLDEIRIRPVAVTDLADLADFRCSTGEAWQQEVEEQVQGPLARRYLMSPPRFDGRMLVGEATGGEILVVGAHHIEPTLEPDVGYVEVVATSFSARGRRIELPGRDISLGMLMFFAIAKQMRTLKRHSRTFARVDRRNRQALALCSRVGLIDEYPDPHDETLVQRWGELPG